MLDQKENITFIISTIKFGCENFQICTKDNPYTATILSDGTFVLYKYDYNCETYKELSSIPFEEVTFWKKSEDEEDVFMGAYFASIDCEVRFDLLKKDITANQFDKFIEKYAEQCRPDISRLRKKEFKIRNFCCFLFSEEFRVLLFLVGGSCFIYTAIKSLLMK